MWIHKTEIPLSQIALSDRQKFRGFNIVRITFILGPCIAVEGIRPRRLYCVPIVRVRAYLRSFVYLKFQQILPESGSARKRHATTYSRSIAEVRRVASRLVSSHRVSSHRVASHRVATHRVALVRAWTISLLVLGGTRAFMPLVEAARHTVACARRNYTIKWCPDGRQLGAPWYSPFSSCHSESICIVMAPRATPLRINTAADSTLLSSPLLCSALLYVVRLKRTLHFLLPLKHFLKRWRNAFLWGAIPYLLRKFQRGSMQFLDSIPSAIFTLRNVINLYLAS